MTLSEAYYLVAQPCRSLEQSLSGVLVHDQPTSLWRDRTHRGGLGRGGPVHPCRLWWDTASSVVHLGLQGGRTECGGGAGLDWRAGIMIRRGGSLPRSATLLTQLKRELERGRVLHTATQQTRHTFSYIETHTDSQGHMENTHRHLRAHTHTIWHCAYLCILSHEHIIVFLTKQ